MKNTLERLYLCLGSLRLTVVCLALAMVLVFVGTIAQVEIGIYEAQSRFFRSLVAPLPIPGTRWTIPVLPGGALVGGLLLANLVCAFVQRFFFNHDRSRPIDHIRADRSVLTDPRFAVRPGRTGLFLIHLGLILLLLGQLATDLFSVESHMRLSEGQGRNYSEDPRRCELAIVDTTAPDHDAVVAIPDTLLARRREITHPQLPFAVHVRQYWANSTPRAPTDPHPPAASPRDAEPEAAFEPAPSETRSDRRNIPTATLEFLDGSASLGTRVASLWLDQPRTFQHQGRTYRVQLRPLRYYKPFTLELIEFAHDTYKGTDIPRNFSSEIRVINPATGENRSVRIYMNNPLRYGGETFYQSGYDERDPRATILQVVRNPGWLTPYLACTLIAVGLAMQFLLHLTNHLKRRTA